jgi:prepilin peptidase CpaA
MKVPLPEGPVLLLVCAGLVAAAVADVRSRKIPNPLVAALATGGLGHALVVGGIHAALGSVLGALVGLALLVWPFHRGLLGGGDVKLLGAIGCWVGALGVVRALLVASIVGGVLAAAFLVRLGRGQRSEVGRNLASFARTGQLAVPAPEHIDRSRGLPYGVALAIGGAWVLWLGVG